MLAVSGKLISCPSELLGLIGVKVEAGSISKKMRQRSERSGAGFVFECIESQEFSAKLDR